MVAPRRGRGGGGRGATAPPSAAEVSPDPAHTPCTSSVPCTLLTPVAPHSLSFRPLVLPEACDLALHLPADARSAARASFDGRGACRLPAGACAAGGRGGAHGVAASDRDEESGARR